MTPPSGTSALHGREDVSVAARCVSRYTASMSMPRRFTDSVPIRFEVNTVSRMDSALRDGETRT